MNGSDQIEYNKKFKDLKKLGVLREKASEAMALGGPHPLNLSTKEVYNYYHN